MKPLTSILLALVIGAAVSACTSSRSTELTRSKAKDVIESNPKFKQSDPHMSLDANDVENGIKAGYWTRKEFLLGEYLDLTPLGHKYFTKFEPQLAGERVVDCIKPPRYYVIEVTGITDAAGSTNGNRKVVEFLVGAHFEGGMRDVEKVLVMPTKEKASVVLQLYDDGWRAQFD
jgi:hypothetical protein